MADNYLEYARENYEKRKTEWLRKKKHLPKVANRSIEEPDDDSL